MGPLLFCISNKVLPQEIKHLRSFLYDDNRKALAIQQSTENISEDLAALRKWIKRNKMRLAEDNILVLQFRGEQQNFFANNQICIPSEIVKDLGILLSPDLNFLSREP